MSDQITYLLVGAGVIIVILIVANWLFGKNLKSMNFKMFGVGFGMETHAMKSSPQQYSQQNSNRSTRQQREVQSVEKNPTVTFDFWSKWLVVNGIGFGALIYLLEGIGFDLNNIFMWAILGGLLGILQCLFMKRYIYGPFWLPTIGLDVFIFIIAQIVYETTNNDLYTLIALSIALFIGPWLISGIYNRGN